MINLIAMRLNGRTERDVPTQGEWGATRVIEENTRSMQEPPEKKNPDLSQIEA